MSIQSKILMKKAFRYKVRFEKMQVQQIEHVDNNYTGGQHEKDTCNSAIAAYAAFLRASFRLLCQKNAAGYTGH